MDDVQDAGREVLLAKLLADEVKRYGDSPALLAAMRAAGIRSLDVYGPPDPDDPAGDPIIYGRHTLNPGKLKVRITDRAAFEAWVRRDHPEWLVVIETIDPQKEIDLLTLIERMGRPVDPGTGQVIPGVKVERGEPHLTTTKTAAARETIRAALDGRPLLALPAGRQEGHDGDREPDRPGG